MMVGNGGLSVPPGFRFHPTDEELLYYYLRKKVSYEPIDFDVITEVDLNKLEPWDLKDKCRIGTGPQNEWYFFSHKDKKYPTGTRTNRATTAGFWKATGRDKAIHVSNSKRIGLRKTLVFYTGRAPHGQKTQWIMHEYRLDEDAATTAPLDIHEDGWVICRVFTKKNHTRGYSPSNEVDQEEPVVPFHASSAACTFDLKHYSDQPNNFTFHPDTCIHLPPLLSSESTLHTSFLSSNNTNAVDLLTLTSGGGGGLSTASSAATGLIQQDKFCGDWSFLDKLLATQDHVSRGNHFSHLADFNNIPPPQYHRFPFPCHATFEPTADWNNH